MGCLLGRCEIVWKGSICRYVQYVLGFTDGVLRLDGKVVSAGMYNTSWVLQME